MGTYFDDVVAEDVGNAAYWNGKLGGLDDQLVVHDGLIEGLADGSGFGNQNANLVLAGPGAGDPAAASFRALVANDIPNLNASKINAGTFDNARINWASPSAIGSSTAAAGTFTALVATSLTITSADANAITLQRNSTISIMSTVASDTGGQSTQIMGRKSRGTIASPTAIQTNDTMISLFGLGYDGSTYANAGAMQFNASENWNGTSHGSRFVISPVPNGSTTPAAALVVHDNARLQIIGALDHDGSQAGFYGTAPVSKPTVTGSRGGNAALASLLTALADLGLVTNSSS